MASDKSKMIEMRYFATYQYAALCKAAIWNPWNLQVLATFWDQMDIPEEDGFKKYSLLHYFIATVIEDDVHRDFWQRQDEANGAGANDFYANEMLRYHWRPFKSLDTWSKQFKTPEDDDPEEKSAEYHSDMLMSKEYDLIFGQVVDEVFFILFLNREFLQKFNEYISEIRAFYFWSEWPKCERTYMPQWVKNAVFHRERGYCALCKKNISWLISTNKDCQYDHIVPLKNFWINDVSNIQLLCQKCNLKKGDWKPVTSSIYESWY